MKILVVGGTGLSGAHASLFLRDQGHDITIMSRSKPQTPCLQDFKFMQGNYIEDDVATESLRGFDALLFAAGADIRQLPEGESPESFFERANTVAIPRFFQKAKDAGIAKAVYIGTYYPQVVPEKIDTDPYVRSRHLSDEALRAMNSADFTVCSLNAPFILGHVDGLVLPHVQALVMYAAGQMEGVPIFAPAGGVNHITSQSLSEAIAAAFEHGKGGKAYLVGDENLTWKEYLEMFCASAGNPLSLEVSTEEHPLFPDMIMYAGRGATVSYEPDLSDFSYSRNNVKACIDQVVQAYKPA